MGLKASTLSLHAWWPVPPWKLSPKALNPIRVSSGTAGRGSLGVVKTLLSGNSLGPEALGWELGTKTGHALHSVVVGVVA